MAISAKAVANFFIDAAAQAGDTSLSPMKLQKLVYYAHGWHLGLTGEPLIDGEIQAWPYGPVIPELYHEFKHFGNWQVTDHATDMIWNGAPGKTQDFAFGAPKVDNDGSPESDRRLAILNRVWEVYKAYTATQLSNVTHQPNTPWDTVNKQYVGGIPKGTAIPDDIIRAYFAKMASAGGG